MGAKDEVVKVLRLDWAALELAFDNHSTDMASYLDRMAGEVVTAVKDDAEDTVQARVSAEPDRFVALEPIPSREQYRMMERFIDTVHHGELKERLKDSIVGKGAFRRFKDVVTQYAEERKRWFAFRDVLARQYIMDWLRQHRVEVVEPPPWSLEMPPPPEPPLPGTEEPQPDAEEVRPETGELKRYLQAWARAHGEEYAYLFGPAAFDRLAEDMSGEFTFFRRR